MSSIDYEEILATVARSAVPTLADWCTVDLVEPGSPLPRQVAVAHVNEQKVRLARELGERYPRDPDAPRGVPEVLRTGKSELYPHIPRELLERGGRDEEHLRLIREMALESAMIVPLRVRGRTFGTLTFVYAESKRHYTQDDLSFAEDFARRAAMAIENAIVLKEAEAARVREQALRSDAELANRAKDEFLATVSHELRTPLTAILGWATLLRRRKAPPEIDRGLATIERNARLQTKLIEDVLDISRIISGKLALNVGGAKLGDVIGAAIETVTPAANLKGIVITTHLPADALTISADADRLQQVVWNLLANAVKFTPKGGKVEVRAGRDGSDVWFSVRDSGEGIRRPLLPILFEPFRQADASTTRRHGGLGLGLAIVRQLVLAHGGTVSADSAGEGQGSTFLVRLPARAVVPVMSRQGLGALADPSTSVPGDRRGIAPRRPARAQSRRRSRRARHTRRGPGRARRRGARGLVGAPGPARARRGAPARPRERHRDAGDGRLRAHSDHPRAAARAGRPDPRHRPHGLRAAGGRPARARGGLPDAHRQAGRAAAAHAGDRQHRARGAASA